MEGIISDGGGDGGDGGDGGVFRDPERLQYEPSVVRPVKVDRSLSRPRTEPLSSSKKTSYGSADKAEFRQSHAAHAVKWGANRKCRGTQVPGLGLDCPAPAFARGSSLTTSFFLMKPHLIWNSGDDNDQRFLVSRLDQELKTLQSSLQSCSPPNIPLEQSLGRQSSLFQPPLPRAAWAYSESAHGSKRVMASKVEARPADIQAGIDNGFIRALAGLASPSWGENFGSYP